MLRFKLGSVPVTIHASHAFVALLLGLDFAPGRGQQPVLVGLAAVGVIFSVLIHELGHASASLAFGYQPAIELAWLGGHTTPNAPGHIPWKRDVALTLAGPAAGLGLSLASYGLRAAFHPGSDALDFLLRFLFEANLLWTILNLVPVLPLDGGRVAHALLSRLFGARGSLAAHAVGALVGGGLAAFALQKGSPFAALLFGLMAFRSVTILWQSLGARSGKNAIAEPLLTEARARLDAGALRDARRLAEQVLEQLSEPLTRSRAQHLLGWVALKEGQGRKALDHFSQVQRIRVEEEALAAAFSLVGDDARALPLWELAHQKRPSRTLLHEWAGTLLREGRQREALALSGVDAATAFGVGSRVLFLREQFAAAGALGEAGLQLGPSVELAYDTACAWARAGQVDDALRLLRQAKALGFKDFAYARTDSDLAKLHGHPEFEVWASGRQENAPS